MLEKTIFQKKYRTKYKQMHPEFYLKEVSKEDREIYTEGEILTGRKNNGDFNKFNNFGKDTRGVPRNTVKTRFINSFKKYVDNKILEGKEEEVFDRMWKSSKGGSYQHLQYLFDRIVGKQKEEIDIKTEQKLNVSFLLGDEDPIEESK